MREYHFKDSFVWFYWHANKKKCSCIRSPTKGFDQEGATARDGRK